MCDTWKNDNKKTVWIKRKEREYLSSQQLPNQRFSVQLFSKIGSVTSPGFVFNINLRRWRNKNAKMSQTMWSKISTSYLRNNLEVKASNLYTFLWDFLCSSKYLAGIKDHLAKLDIWCKFYVKLEIPLLRFPNPEQTPKYWISKQMSPKNKVPWKFQKPLKEYWKVNQKNLNRKLKKLN